MPTEPEQSQDFGATDAPVDLAEASDEEAQVVVRVEAVFKELTLLKALGCAFFALAAVAAMLPVLLFGEAGGAPSLATLAVLVLAASGAAVGVLGALVRALRRWAQFAGPGLLLAAAAVSPLGMSIETTPDLELALAFLYAVNWLLSLEYLLALRRFSDLGAYVVRQRLTSFDLGGVVNHFVAYGLGVVAVIAVVTALVALFVPSALSLGSDEVFNRSVELGSIMGIAIASAIVFSLSAMILTLARTLVPSRVDVESVAYSRTHMEDLLTGSRVIDLQRRGGGGGVGD